MCRVIIAVALVQYVTFVTCLDLGVAGCFHQIGAGRRRKKISSNRPGPFVLVRSYYLALALLSRKTSFLLFFSPFYLPPFFLSLSLRRFRDFALSPIRSSRSTGQSLLSYRNLSLACPAFFRKPSHSCLDGAIAQMLTRLESSAGGDRRRLSRHKGTYVHLLHLQSETLACQRN